MITVSRVLCAVDFSDVSARALAYAAATAKWYGAPLRVVHAFPELPTADMFPSLSAELAPQGAVTLDRGRFQRAAEQFVASAAAAAPAWELVVRDDDDVARAVREEAAAYEPGLIVLGTEGRTGVARLLQRSVAEEVLRGVDCPVMVVPAVATTAVPAGDVGFDSLLCAVDFSEGSLTACRYAVSLAEEADANLTLLHVIEVPPEVQPHDPGLSLAEVRAAAVADRLTRLRALVPPESRPFFRLETLVEEGNPASILLAAASERKADLIVLGVRERSALDRVVFGSNTSAILQHATCPVLAVHPASAATS